MHKYPRALLALFPALLLGLFAVACTPDTPGNSGSNSTPPDGDRVVVESPIEEVEVIVRESAPPQYAVNITSGLPSGCAVFDKAEETGRDGTTITIRVTHTMPADPDVACTMIYGYHESTVDLGSDFESGVEYTVKVNDEVVTFVAQ